MSGPAAIATNPAIPPFNEASRSILPRTQEDRKMAAIVPAAPARLELTTTLLTATALEIPPSEGYQPALKARNPAQTMNAPKVTMGTLLGGVALTVPSARKLPCRGPTISTAARAAHPPVE